MKAFHILCVLVFFILNLKGFDSFSQSGFTPVPPPSGGAELICGTQDPTGYMWFGGSGVHRYDGYRYKSYFNDPRDTSSLAFNRIQSIYADRKGIIWVGTNGGGIDRLDPETGIFTHFRHDPNNPTSISNDTITVILEDRDGKIWAGTERVGLNYLDPKTGVVTRFRHNPNDTNSLSHDKVRALYEDRQGTIWVGTGFPTRGSSKKEGGLNRFNPLNKNFTRFLHNPKDPSSLIDNRVRTIFEDSKGRFWIGTAGDGLHTMNREMGSFERHQYDPSDPNGLSRPPVRNTELYLDDLITFIREDAGGAIWIGTTSGGLNRYDPATSKISYYASLKEKSTVNDVSSFWWSTTSKDGVLWIATVYEGIYRLDPLKKQIPHYDIGTSVNSLLQDGRGNLWLGTNNGLMVYDSAGRNKKVFVHDISDTTSLSGNFVYTIVEDRSSAIWIGTDNGLNRYDHQSQKFTHYPFDLDTLPNFNVAKNLIIVMYEDSEGSFWLGLGHNGLAQMNRQTGTFTFYRQSTTDTTSLSSNTIISIREDKKGYLWIGTQEKGLNRFDKKSKRFQRYFSGTDIRIIFEDADDTLWIGTNRGLYYFNPSNNSFVLFTNLGAGLTENINVFHILEDDQRSLWINTSIGLFRLGHDRSQISYFGNKHGLIPPSFMQQHGSFKGKGDELFFVDNVNNGYYAFFPEQLKGNATPPDLHITGFKLGDQLVRSFKQTNEIHLAYQQNVFSFDFAGIHFSSPEDNRHVFMLENLDNDWRKAGEEKTAYYYSVPPGKYIFRVKAASSDGVWAERSINIFISPPWWKTWWAYFMYVLLFIAGVLATHRIQKTRVIQAERRRTQERELAQAKEIEKAYHELKTTQAQLVQREKMASLGELTAGIAHEIQNPLNFVNNFSELNAELFDDLEQEADKGNLDEIKSIAKDIKENQQKINHHGKRADAIVKGMLQHSRSSIGIKELTDINVLVDEYFRLAYHGLRAKDKSFNATMKTDFDETIGNISIIPQDIGRVILNVINNAFYAVSAKASTTTNGSYEPTVSVSTKKIGDKVEVRVVDNGNGISPKILDKIFQPFFTTKPTGQGTGLGLSLAYDIVKAHGGELKVETPFGQESEGAEFIIYLPLK
jgi:ligand-binding sensor domain-containing protein/signal transduction histidine kinase